MTATQREGPLWDLLRLSLNKDIPVDEFMDKAHEVKEVLEDKYYFLHHEAQLLDNLVPEIAGKVEWRKGLQYRKPAQSLDTP